MAKIEFNIPDGKLSKYVGFLSRNWGYQDEVPDPENEGEKIPNPQSKGDFVKEHIADWIKAVLKARIKYEAEATAGETAITEEEPLEIA